MPGGQISIEAHYYIIKHANYIVSMQFNDMYIPGFSLASFTSLDAGNKKSNISFCNNGEESTEQIVSCTSYIM